MYYIIYIYSQYLTWYAIDGFESFEDKDLEYMRNAW